RDGPGARGSLRPASGRARSQWRRGRAEPRRAPADGAREAQPAAPHAAGDAHVQVARAIARDRERERPMATRDNGATKFETVRYEPKGAICHIVLNRPEKLNAATDQLVEEVNDALFEFDADPELKVAIISGAGRAFCSGADVRQRQLRTREELKRLRSEEHTSELQSRFDLVCRLL